MGDRAGMFLYQEALLLALRDDRGTVERGAWSTHAVAAGILADLVLAERITIGAGKGLVTVVDRAALGDPVLDDALAAIGAAGRRAQAKRWVARFAKKKVFRSAAARLCELGVLRGEVRSVLLFFSRRVYPEIDPGPEREIVERLRGAIFGDSSEVEPRTAVLVSIASATGLLGAHFPKRELKARRERIEIIAEGDAVGEAAARVIQEIHAAIIVSTVAASAAAASG